MSNYTNESAPSWQLEYGREETGEASLFKFFNAVYAWMAVGLAVTAVTAVFVSQTPGLVRAIYGGGSGMIVVFMLGAFALAWGAQYAALKINAAAGLIMFMLYAVAIGAMFSGIILIYPVSTIGAAFVITAGTFAGMSIYGFITKRDLTTIGSYLIMGVIGAFLASIVNVFVASNLLSWLITYAVLALFIGITAYETQKLKNMAIEHAHDGQTLGRIAVIGSIVLYIAFINMFLSILRILGGRNN